MYIKLCFSIVMNTFDIVLKKMGSRQADLARVLNVSPQAVCQWVKGRRPIPVRLALRVETLCGVSRHELRPDVFGPPPPNKEEAA